MKPLQICLGIIGASILVAGAASIKSRIDHNLLRTQVEKLLAEYKSMSIPTNGSEFKKRNEPNRSNAWWDLKGLFKVDEFINFDPGIGHGTKFDSTSLLYASNSSDLPHIQKYLSQGGLARSQILIFVRQQKALTIPCDYYGTPPKSDMSIRLLVHDFMIAAYAAALTNDKPRLIEDLAAARYVANTDIRSASLFGLSNGIDSWKRILKGALRINEVSPSMSHEIQAFLSKPGLIAPIDESGMYEAEFAMELDSIVSVDSPTVDRTQRPKFLEKFVHAATLEDVQKAIKEKPSGFIPESTTCLLIYRQALERWRPIFNRLASKSSPLRADYDKASGPFYGISKELSDLMGTDILGIVPQEIKDLEQFEMLVHMTATSLQVRSDTGAYPKTLADLIGPGREKEYTYHDNGNGFSVESLFFNEQKHTFDPRNRIAYPSSNAIRPKAMDRYRAQMKEVRAGRLSVLNRKTSAPTSTSSGRGPTKVQSKTP